MRCEKCGNEFEGKFCPECGRAVVAEKNTCKSCGTEFEGKFCPNCGQAVNAPVQVAQPVQPQVIINNTNSNVNTVSTMGIRVKNKWVAFFLCLFLGMFGAHKFYEGKVLMGIIYLFTAGLCGIGWLVDLIVILCKPNPYTV